MMNSSWLICPVCGGKTRDQIRSQSSSQSTTVLKTIIVSQRITSLDNQIRLITPQDNCLGVFLLCPHVVKQLASKAQSGALSDRDYLLLLLQENPTITQTELADVMGKSRRSIQMLMKQLIEDDVIERLGSKKQGTWILK